MLTLGLPDETATADLARRLAAIARPGDVIALRGELGAGKTSFARAFIRTLAGDDVEVPSPTFMLAQTYPPGIWHFDLYRLGTPEEAWEIGIEEAFAGGIALIEWPDRLGPLLPARRLDITLAFADAPTVRAALLNGDAAWQERLAELLSDA